MRTGAYHRFTHIPARKVNKQRFLGDPMMDRPADREGGVAHWVRTICSVQRAHWLRYSRVIPWSEVRGTPRVASGSALGGPRCGRRRVWHAFPRASLPRVGVPGAFYLLLCSLRARHVLLEFGVPFDSNWCACLCFMYYWFT